LSDQQSNDPNILNCEDLSRLAALLTGSSFRQSFQQDPHSALTVEGISLPNTLIEFLSSMSAEELVAAAQLAVFLTGFDLPPEVNACFM
jgi:hypothetical protein